MHNLKKKILMPGTYFDLAWFSLVDKYPKWKLGGGCTILTMCTHTVPCLQLAEANTFLQTTYYQSSLSTLHSPMPPGPHRFDPKIHSSIYYKESFVHWILLTEYIMNSNLMQQGNRCIRATISTMIPLLKKQHLLARYVIAAGLSWFKLVLSWSWSCAGPKLVKLLLRTNS